MGLFNKLFANNKINSADQKLATGEINWRLKPTINATANYPNFLKFITKIEDENNIQFGVHNDVADDIQKTLILRQVIYNSESNPVFTFSFFFHFVEVLGRISFMGNVTNFYKPQELLMPNRESTIIIKSDKKDDLTIDEYEKYYHELLSQALSVQGYNPNDYFIKRLNGAMCVFKMMEQNVRNEK